MHPVVYHDKPKMRFNQPVTALLLLIFLLSRELAATGLESQEVGEDKVPGAESSEGLTPDPEQQRERYVQQQIAAGREAMREGRVDQPEDNCAWYFYQNALNADPDSPEAQTGLQMVQQSMVASALEYARELDFESADDLLAEASLVQESQVLIEEANEEIVVFRQQRAAELELAAVSAMNSGNFGAADRIVIELIALGEAETLVRELRKKIEEARLYGGFYPGQLVRDRFLNAELWAPDMIVIPRGSFMMGSSSGEEGRVDNEGPQHRVTLQRGFAIGVREVSVAEFEIFIERNGYTTDAERNGWSTVYDHYSGRLARQDNIDWKMSYEGHKANERDPVVHVSWNDVKAYVKWLARETGKPYRLPSEAEFEYVLRGGKSSKYWWGDGSPNRTVENLSGEDDTSRTRRSWSVYFEKYGDNYWGPAPVGSFEVNPFGLHDISGNVGEWVEDCWHDTYMRAPVDGTSWVNPGCKLRVIRGGYWASSPEQTRSAFRLSSLPERSDARIGFRVARDL